MYSAILRLISPTRAEAETDEKLMKEGLFTTQVRGDGTVQVEVEDLEPQHIEITAEDFERWRKDYYEQDIGCKENLSMDAYYAKRANEIVNLSFRQGALSEVKARVTYAPS